MFSPQVKILFQCTTTITQLLHNASECKLTLGPQLTPNKLKNCYPCLLAAPRGGGYPSAFFLAPKFPGALPHLCKSCIAPSVWKKLFAQKIQRIHIRKVKNLDFSNCYCFSAVSLTLRSAALPVGACSC